MAGSQQLQTTENETAISEYNEETLCRDLAEIPTRMRMFSLSMRSLYAENAVSSKSPVAAKLNKLRDDMKADALVYIKGLLPASTRLIECINDFFDNYVDYSYDEWLSRLPSILEDVTEYTECCKVVVTMHERVMASLKRREDEAKVQYLEQELNSLINALEGLPSSMTAFAKGMRTLYAEMFHCSNEIEVSDFNLIRDKMMTNSQVYINVLLPLFTKLVENIDEIFEICADQDFEEWRNGLENFMKDLRGYRQQAQTVISSHKDVKTSLLPMEREIEQIFVKGGSSCRGKIRKYAVSGQPSSTTFQQVFLFTACSIVIAGNFYFFHCKQMFTNHFFRFVVAGFMGCCFYKLLSCCIMPLINKSIHSSDLILDSNKAVTDMKALVVGEMIPKLSRYIDCVENSACFFSKIEKQLVKLKDSKTDYKLRSYYILLKQKEPTIRSKCNHYFAIIPDIRSDLIAIAEKHKLFSKEPA